MFSSYLRCRNHEMCPGTARIAVENIDEILPMREHSTECRRFENALSIAQFRNALREALGTHWYQLKDLYDTVKLV